MKKTSWIIPLFASAAFFLFAIGMSAADPHPSGKPVQGTLRTDNPITVQDKENYWFQVGGAPVGAQVKLWVDNGDGKGFRDFGIIGKTSQSNTAYAKSGSLDLSKTLNCSSYEYLEPGRILSVGNRDLFVKFYVEYVGLDKVSNVSWAVHDCSQTPPPERPAQGDATLFPYTLESTWGRNHIMKPFPDSYDSGMSSPLKRFAGRYFDGQDRGGSNMGLNFEWYKPYGSATNVGGGNDVKIVGDKIFTPLGSTIAAYNKDTFLSRLANKDNSSLAVFAGTKEPRTQRPEGELTPSPYDLGILPWDAYIYPEHTSNAWLREACDCHTGVTWSTVDDRGFVYFNDRFGFGIADPNMRIIVQVRETGGLTDKDGKPIPYGYRTGRNGIVRLTDMDGYGAPHTDGDHITIITNQVNNETKYYAVITGTPSGGDGGTRVLDVTTPGDPKYVRSSPDENIMDLVQWGGIVAATTRTQEGFAEINPEIRIYNTADFISGANPKKVFSAGDPKRSQQQSPTYGGLDIDKVSGKIYSFHYAANPRPKSSISAYVLPKASLSVFSPGAGGGPESYAEKKYELTQETMGGRSGSPGWNGYQYIFTVEDLDYNNGYLIARGKSPEGYGDVKIFIFKNGQPEELSTRGFIKDYYKGLGHIYQASAHTIGGKDYLFVSGFYLADVYELEPVSRDTATTPAPPATEICANNIDDDGDGQVDEGCGTTPPPPPPSASCNAALTFDKTSVPYKGSMTESWTVVGADIGQVYGDCGQGATPISAGPQTYTFNNLTKTMTCRVYGKIGGQEKCSASATVTVGAPPAGGGDGGGLGAPVTADNSQGTAFQYYYDNESSPVASGGGAVTLRQGSSGTDVAALQALLNQKISAGLSTDGKFGPKTKAAVVSYQNANGLAADGVVGPKTRAALGI